MNRRFLCLPPSLGVLLPVLLLLAARAAGADRVPTAKETEFFESKIRPILADHCYKCHASGAEKVKGGLLLDSREGWMKGGDSGPVIVPGNPDKSLLITAVRYRDKDVQMPPNDRRLADSQIADLEAWVRMGAPDPRTGPAPKHDYKVDLARVRATHWAYRPVTKPAVPQPADPGSWVRSPIDAFILEKLVAKGLVPSPQADKVTLLRRVSFDLTGLPPTAEELAAFLNDPTADAFARVVDRLLASPRYGERWGRHWLDLAKFADTRGPVGQNRDPRYLWAWTYRDWVIRALNEDLPYDQFLLQQIAADKLPSASDPRTLAALGFLTLGNRFNNQANDIIDDRIDLLGKATMATTIACARCHDHKFDPIPTRDYYSLHGVFASSTEPREGPILETPKETPAYKAYLKELAAAEGAVGKFREDAMDKLAADRLKQIGDYLLALHDYRRQTNGLPRNEFMRRRGLNGNLSSQWENALKDWRRKHHPVWAPWFAFAALEEETFAAPARELAARFYANDTAGKPINTLVARAFATPPGTLRQVAARYESIFAEIDKEWRSALAAHEIRKRAASSPPPEPTALPDPAREEVRAVLYARNSPTHLDEARVNDLINRDDRLRNRLNALVAAVNDVKATHPGAPARAHVLEDAAKPRDSAVFVKGNPGNRGPVVPRQFLEVLSPDSRPAFRHGSGRLELAQAIARPDNPLTARVIANRVWLHHFGDGLVDSPDDFGTRSEPPSHPELLDWLAATLVEDGWSLKQLHRRILLAAVYQQSSEDNPRLAQVDPNNQLYWQMNRRRLEFEALRDTLLFIGGKLDLTMGGPPVRLNAEPYSRRRSIYGFVDRNALPNMLLTFDFANPDLTTGRRDQTIIPQQALFMLNNPLVVEQARDLVRRPDFRALSDPNEQLALLYQLIYQRNPTAVEAKLALAYLHGETDSRTSGAQVGQTAWEYGFGTYNPQARRITDFARMSRFAEGAWTPAPAGRAAANAAKLAGLRLTAIGGHPGPGYAAIRRWTAPRDGFISIDATLGHSGREGDGVRGLILSSGTGLLGSWPALRTNVATRLPRVLVKRGDTIDFFVSGLNNPRADNFVWAPVIRLIDGRSGRQDVVVWDAAKEFGNATGEDRLGAWEKLAQVLLETNELSFVN